MTRALELRPALLCSLCALFRACEAGEEQGGDTSTQTGTSEGSESTGPTETPTETSAGETQASETETGASETETGEMCTGESCASTLTLTFNHALPLLDGPYRLLITTLNNDIQCGIDAELEGSESCFGFIFADMDWDSEQIIVTLTSPFYDTDNNPDATPFPTIYAELEQQANVVLWEMEVEIDGGEAIMPDPCGLTCWEAVGEATIVLEP